jgi:hypothetical protein
VLKSGGKHYYLHGKPIGPTCYESLGHKPKQLPATKVVANEQPDLFKEVEK